MARKSIAGSGKLETFAESLTLLRGFTGFCSMWQAWNPCPLHRRAANGAMGAIFLNILTICLRESDEQSLNLAACLQLTFVVKHSNRRAERAAWQNTSVVKN